MDFCDLQPHCLGFHDGEFLPKLSEMAETCVRYCANTYVHAHTFQVICPQIILKGLTINNCIKNKTILQSLKELIPKFF